ncbi:MAG: 2-isopropylmalate synthase [Firmicutes bacterium]|nr:2-isopropylmalate synthase [Bacillota bacterium]
MKKNWKNEDWWISSFNFKDEVRKDMDIAESIEFHDATLRDGEQTPGVVLKKEEKIEIAKRLAEAGVHRIEAGMPAVSEEDRKAIEEIKKLNLRSKIFGFVRAKEEDIVMCSECGVDGVIIEIPIGKPKLELQFGWDVNIIIERSIEAITKAKEHGLYTVYFPYDTTRADEADLERLLTEVMKASPPDSIGLVDTMGCTLPGAIAYMIRLIKQKTNLPVEIHTHNDFGLSLANSLQAIMSGASVVHCCVNGIGERTGNCSLEEIVVACKLLLGLDVNIDIKRLVELSKLVEEMTGFKLAKNKPIVGESNFTRESGIGADALLTAPLAMFAMNPRFLGRQPELVLGKKSGMTSIEMKLKRYNIELDEEAKKALLSDVKSLGIQKKGVLTDEEFLALTKRYSK